MTKKRCEGSGGPNSWDVLPIESKGDEDPAQLFTAVGAALTAWERLDAEQAALFALLVGSRQGAAVAAYGTVTSPSAKAEMVRAAAEVLYQPFETLLSDIKVAVSELQHLAGRRNDIAHGIVSHYSGSANGGPMIRHGFFLAPNPFNTGKKLSFDKQAEQFGAVPVGGVRYAYTAKQVDHYAKQFDACRAVMSDLYDKVRDHRTAHDQGMAEVVKRLAAEEEGNE